MNLAEFNTGTGAPQTKPWLRPVAFSLESQTLLASNATITDLACVDIQTSNITSFRGAIALPFRVGGSVPTITGAAGVTISYDSFIGGVGVIGPAGTASLFAPTSANINVVLPDSVTGSLIWFTVINQNTAVIGSIIVGPDGTANAIPAAQSATKSTSTQFWYQKQASTQWTCLNS
jgi:hypothetical protein